MRGFANKQKIMMRRDCKAKRRTVARQEYEGKGKPGCC
jgi:hypothetical protein